MSVTTQLIGRFGNQLFQYCYARAYAEQTGQELRLPPWIGDSLFEITPTEKPDGKSALLGGYRQDQASLIYSRRQARKWLKFRPEVEDALEKAALPCAHLRRGDYQGYGYVIVSNDSYFNAAFKYLTPPYQVIHVSEELSGPDCELQDFYTLMTAPVLFRANSSFSWWAGTLGEGTVYSPVIDGLQGGKEQDCEFVEGNWPRLANIDGVTDLHMFKESDRYDYDLKPEDLVIDAGAHKGNFTKTIWEKYGCEIWAFEPMRVYCETLYNLFALDPKIQVFFAGLGGFNRGEVLHYKGDASGAFAEGEGETVLIRSIYDVVVDRKVALLKLNIEGMEFEVLEAILENRMAKQFANIQVQFHTCAPDAENRYRKIRERLLETHRTTFDEPWCWQNFELKP